MLCVADLDDIDFRRLFDTYDRATEIRRRALGLHPGKQRSTPQR